MNHIPTCINRCLNTFFKGNMCAGQDELGEEALRSGFLLKAMKSLLSFSSHHVRKESLWLLSNLTAGSCLSVKAVLEAGLLPIVVKMLDENFDIQKEVCSHRYDIIEMMRVHTV